MTDLKVQLEDICDRLGMAETPEILEALATAVTRGHHIGALAGEGSGKGALLGMAAVQRCDAGSESVQALVLVPDSGHGRRIAAAIQRVAGPEGLRVSTGAAGADSGCQVVVARASEILPAVRSGQASLAGVGLLVMDGVSRMRDSEEWESVVPIVESISGDCQKIAISDRVDAEFPSFLERQLPRARRWPEEILPVAADPDADGPTPGERAIRVAIASRAMFSDAVMACVRGAEQESCGRLDIHCGTPARAASVAADLEVSGRQTSVDSTVVGVALPGAGPPATAHLGLPFRLDHLGLVLKGDGPAYVIVEPRHGPQLGLLVQRAGRRMKLLPVTNPPGDRDPIRQYRDWLRDEVARGELLSEMLVLEPLFEDIGAVRLAAALSRNLRRRDDRSDFVRPWADVEEALKRDTGAAAQPRDTRPVGTRPAWTKLYFGVGKRDEAKPGDLVGAITGEAGIAGAQVGKVEIMANFSLVDVDSQVADDVVARLDGALIRGRTVPVRRDRNG